MGLWAWLKRRGSLDENDFADEIQSHLAIEARERMNQGADPETARLASKKEFGNVTLTTEAARSVWRPGWVEAIFDLVADVRYSLRSLAKNPAFALTVIAVLGLGIGVNSAVFTMLKSMALSPIAGVARSGSLVVIHGETSTGREVELSYLDYRDLRERNRSFTALMGTTPIKPSIGRGKGAHRVWGEMVTGNYFEVLGVRAHLGRTLLPSDEQAPGRHPVAVISYGLWQRDFGGDPNVLGRTVEINNFPLTVVGVAEPSYHGTVVSYDIDVFVPLMMAPQLGIQFVNVKAGAALTDRRAAVLYAHGFLRPGVSLEQAQAEAGSIFQAVSGARPITDELQRLKVVRCYQSPNGAQTFLLPSLALLAAMGLLVLFTACANIAGMVLVRGLSRRGEVAVRLALGAARMRVMRLLIVENLVLALPGALLGVVLAARGIPVLVGYAEWLAAPERLFFNIEVDALVIGYATAVACVSALVFGLMPAWRTAQVDLVTLINEDASPRGAGRGRLRSGLVVAQVAVSLVLLIGSGLVARSLEAARRAHPGFEMKNAAGLLLDLRANGYEDSRGMVFYRNLLELARADAGVEQASLAYWMPLRVIDPAPLQVAVDGHAPKRGEEIAFLANTITPQYFGTLKVPLLAGRDFDERDDADSTPVMIVNEKFAERFWGSAPNALGKRVLVANKDWRTVVGVAKVLKYSRVDEAPRPYFYVPLYQDYRPSMVLHLRGAIPPAQLADRARALVAKIDPELPVLSSRPMTELTRGSTIFLDLINAMLLVFGAAAMALAALGTYGLVSYSVKNSGREIGIRLALGATGSSVVRTFLGRGLRLGAWGAGLGLVASMAVMRLAGDVLYGVSGIDLHSCAQALLVVLGGVTLATAIPAWRAARTNPLTALRHH